MSHTLNSENKDNVNSKHKSNNWVILTGTRSSSMKALTVTNSIIPFENPDKEVSVLETNGKENPFSNNFTSTFNFLITAPSIYDLEKWRALDKKHQQVIDFLKKERFIIPVLHNSPPKGWLENFSFATAGINIDNLSSTRFIAKKSPLRAYFTPNEKTGIAHYLTILVVNLCAHTGMSIINACEQVGAENQFSGRNIAENIRIDLQGLLRSQVTYLIPLSHEQ